MLATQYTLDVPLAHHAYNIQAPVGDRGLASLNNCPATLARDNLFIIILNRQRKDDDKLPSL